MSKVAFFLVPTLLTLGAAAQSTTFGPEQVITTAASGPFSVYAIDLDGDGDADVLSASESDDKIAWYENQGGGVFGAQQVISTAADGASSVYAADLDGDGDADVLSASGGDDKISFYLNDGTGNFSVQFVITAAADGAASVFAEDLDGDGDMDVLSASSVDARAGATNDAIKTQLPRATAKVPAKITNRYLFMRPPSARSSCRTRRAITCDSEIASRRGCLP